MVLSIPACALRSPVYGLCPKQAGRDPTPWSAETSVCSGDKADILKRWDVFLCKVMPTSISSNSIEYLYKLRRFLRITGFPWRKTNNPMCSENCTYFKGVSFQQHPAYWVKTTIWRRKPVTSLLSPEQLSCGVQKGFGVFERAIYHFAFSSGKCDPMQLAILAGIRILNRRNMFLQDGGE